jgi:Tol biopolymer transport system component
MSDTPASTVTGTGTMTETGTYTATGTETATETTTFTPSPTLAEGDLQLLFADDFSDNTLRDWMIEAGWDMGYSSSGYAAETYHNTLAYLTTTPLYAAVVEIHFTVGSGSARIALRQGEWGGYVAEYTSSGQVALYRSGTLLATASVAATTVWQTHSLRFSAVEDRLRVTFDNAEVLNIQDSAPFPPGLLSIAGLFVDGDPLGVLRVSHAAVWTSTDELVNATQSLQVAEQAALALSEAEAVSSEGMVSPLSAPVPLDNHLVYDIWAPTQRESIYFRDVNTASSSNGTLLVSRAGSIEAMAALSPGGRQVAFVSSMGGNDDTYKNIFVADLSSQNLSSLPIDETRWRALTTDTADNVSNQSPVWSPDGMRVAFESNRSGTWKIWIVDANGENLRRLTNTDGSVNETVPSWSPDGTRIAFTVGGCGTDYDIYAAPVNAQIGPTCTNILSNLLVRGIGDDNLPRWSPNGNYIAFQANRSTRFDVYLRHVNLLPLTLNTGSGASTPNIEINLTSARPNIDATRVANTRTPSWSVNSSQLGVMGNTALTYLDRMYLLNLSFDTTGTAITLLNSDWYTTPLSPNLNSAYDSDLNWSMPACDRTITVAANLRTMPNQASPLVRPDSIPVDTTVSVLGIYRVNPNDPTSSRWYRVSVDWPWVEGWIFYGTFDESAPCLGAVAQYELDQYQMPVLRPLTYTTPLDPYSCVGRAIPEGTTNYVRQFPTTSGTTLYQFGDNLATTRVKLVARYTAGTPQRWDDWYWVTSSQGYGWTSAEYTPSSPMYGTPCRIPEYTSYDAVTGAPSGQAISPVILTAPSGYLSIAAPIYNAIDELRLPPPFNNFPSDDFLNGFQGYGMTEFAFLNQGLYEQTNHIHTGIDFNGTHPNNGAEDTCVPVDTCIVLTSVCTGVVTEVITTATIVQNSGGKVTVRCYSEDGSRSNLYVQYNHLDAASPLPVSGITRFEVDQSMLFRVHQSANVPFPHLHMEVYYRRNSINIRLNPILVFEEDILNSMRSNIGNYYPIDDLPSRNQSPQQTPMPLRLYEWLPFDQVDAVIPVGATPDGMTAAQALLGRPDTDLGILPNQLTLILPAGDVIPPAPNNLQIWSRLPSQGGATNGIQDIYTTLGPDWLNNYVYLTVDALLLAMRG